MSIRLLDQVIKVVAGSALIASTLLILLNVINRYLVQGGLLTLADMDIAPALYDFFDYHLYDLSVMADEVPGLLLAWVAFLGAYLAMRDGGHITFDMITEKLPPSFQQWLIKFSDTLIALFLCILLYQSWRMILVDGATEIETAEIGQGWFMSILVIFPLLMLVAIVEKTIKKIRGK